MKHVKTALILLPVFICTTALAPLALPNDSKRFNEAKQAFKEGNFKQAKTIFQEILEKTPGDHESLFHLGRIYHIERNMEDAIDTLEKAVELNKGNSEYYYWLGVSYFAEAEQAGILRAPSLAKKGKQSLLSSIALNPDNIPARQAVMLFYAAAPGIIGGDEDEALKQANEIKKRDELKGFIALGTCWMLIENFKEAETELKNGTKKYPEEMQLYQTLTSLYIDKMERYDDAKVLLDKMIQIDADYIHAYYQIGKIGAMTGRHLSQAEKSLNHFIKNYKGASKEYFAWAHFRLGTVYLKMNNKQKAESEYKKALKINPDFEEAEDALDEISD